MFSGSEAESEVSNDDDDTISGPFMCEICYCEDDSSSAVFKELYHLMVHTRKKHPTTCVGCYEQFESIGKMMEHIESAGHEQLLMCRRCLTLFPDEITMTQHSCEAEPPRVEDDADVRTDLATEEPVTRNHESERCDGEDIKSVPFIKKEELDEYVEGSCESKLFSYVKSSRIESDDNDDNFEENIESGPFLCEICDLGKGESLAIFKQRHHLVKHILKRHPTTCPGCFQQFESSDEMKDHVKSVDHDLPVCLHCWTVFTDASMRDNHVCSQVSGRKSNNAKRKYRPIYTKPLPISDNYSVKVEPTSDSDESNSDYEVSSSDEESGEDEMEDDDGDCLSCLHCSSNDYFCLPTLRSHTYEKHKTVCCICFEQCDDGESLQRHQNSMNHDVWHCQKCSKLFILNSKYKVHVSAFHPEDCPLHCPYCQTYGTFSMSSLQTHKRKMHAEPLKLEPVQQKPKLEWTISRQVCSLCHEHFFSSYSLLLHMFKYHNNHGQTHVFKCEICNVGFGYSRHFEEHLKEWHLDDTEYLADAQIVLQKVYQKSMSCRICGVSFSSRSKLTRHLRCDHLFARPHKCQICLRAFPEDSDLRVHCHRDHNGPNPHICPVCDLEFGDDLVKLERHLTKQHGYDGLPMCYCFTHNRKFITIPGFRDHYRGLHLNMNEKLRTPCDICGKVLSNRFLKNQHIIRMHGPRMEVECKICGNIFAHKETLNTHMMKHTDSFKCAVCGKTFEGKQQLERHHVVHTGEKPFACDICGIRVSQKSALQRHQRVVHPNGMLKDNARPTYQRRTRGPLVKKSEGRSGVDGQESAKIDGGNAGVDSKTKEPKRKGRRSKKRQRQSSSVSDMWDSENEQDDSVLEAGRRNPRRKRQMSTYREASTSDSDVEESTQTVIEDDVSNRERNSNATKIQRKTTASRKKTGKPRKTSQ